MAYHSTYFCWRDACYTLYIKSKTCLAHFYILTSDSCLLATMSETLLLVYTSCSLLTLVLMLTVLNFCSSNGYYLMYFNWQSIRWVWFIRTTFTWSLKSSELSPCGLACGTTPVPFSHLPSSSLPSLSTTEASLFWSTYQLLRQTCSCCLFTAYLFTDTDSSRSLLAINNSI